MFEESKVLKSSSEFLRCSANRFSLYLRMVSIVGRFSFCDGRTPRAKIMTTYSAVAWWVIDRVLGNIYRVVTYVGYADA